MRGPLGILEPSPAAAEIVPDIVLVPLAAFDRAGHRIGYGAGHYDRTLAHLRKVKRDRGDRPRLRGAGSRGRAGIAARRGAGLCANGNRRIRFPEFMILRILFVGDVVGRSGRTAISDHLPGLIRDWALDLVVVNGENAAGGFGITEAIYQEFIDAGADAVTLGNHAWDQREALVFIERAPRLVRPANFPKGTPGRGAALIDTRNGKRALVVNAIGRVFMTPFDDPFASSTANSKPVRCGRRPTRSWSIFIARRRAKSRDRIFLRRPRQSRRRHPHPCADRRPPDPARRHRLHDRRRHDRRLRFDIGMQKEEPLRRFTTRHSLGRFEPAPAWRR